MKGCTQLNLFQMHSDLGKVVQSIIKEFKRNAPRFHNGLPYAASSGSSISVMPSPLPGEPLAVDPEPNHGQLSNIYSATSEANSNIYSPSSSEEPGGSGGGGGSSEIDNVMKRLQDLNGQELGEICANPDLLLDYIHSMDSVVDLQKQRKQLVDQNHSIAKENLSHEPEVEDLQLDLKATFEEYNDAFSRLEEKVRKQDELRQIYEPHNIMNNLRISIMQAEEESEEIAENFLQSKTNLDEFLSNFLEKRKTCHLRRMKEERFKSHVT